MKIRRIEFPCGPITLEGMVSVPEGPGPFGLVVVCHPHPLYGGNMFNNVVHAVCENLGEKGLAWLKFNFRGVGRSGGRHADGIGEQEDAQAAISSGGGQERIDPEMIGVCGYSFGSTVAFAVAAKDPAIRTHRADPNNGREARATKVVFNNEAGANWLNSSWPK